MSLWDEIIATSSQGQSNNTHGADPGNANNGSNPSDSNSSVNDDAFVFYPRAYITLSVTLEGTDEQDTGAIPVKCSVSLKPHNQASEATFTIRGSALPFDPRQIAGGFCTIYLGCPDTVDGDVNQSQFRRFVGFIDEMVTKRDEKGTLVEIKARDMSAICRDFHPIPAANQPKYSDTIADAINNILSAVPGAQNRLSLNEDGDLSSRSLSSAAPSRSQQAKVQLPPNCTAWQAIEHVCGLVSLLVTVVQDEIVLKVPETVYQNNDDPVATFIFGGAQANTLSVETTKKFVRNRKGILVQSYDPTTRTTLEAKYPPDSDLLPLRRPPAHVGGSQTRAAGSSHSSGRGGSSRGGRSTTQTQQANGQTSSSSTNPPERDVFPAPQGLHTQDALDAYAQRLYRERSQQEIEGKVSCPMWTQDLLGLGNGSRFELQIDPDLSAELRNTDSEQAAIDLLVQRLDMTEDAARALIRASQHTPTDHWYARTVTLDFDAEGVCKLDLDFLNLIQIESSSDSQSSSSNNGTTPNIFS